MTEKLESFKGKIDDTAREFMDDETFESTWKNETWWNDTIARGKDFLENKKYEDEQWWRDFVQELASLSFDSLVEVVCTDDQDIEQINEVCADPEKKKEELMDAI